MKQDWYSTVQKPVNRRQSVKKQQKVPEKIAADILTKLTKQGNFNG